MKRNTEAYLLAPADWVLMPLARALAGQAAGVDKVGINMFDANRKENLAALMRALRDRSLAAESVANPDG